MKNDQDMVIRMNKGSSPRTKKAYIARRIEEIAEKKKSEINNNFPEIVISEKNLAINARLLPKEKIIEKLCKTNYIQLHDIFDIENKIQTIRDQNKIIYAQKSELKARVDADVKNLYESLWLGEEDTEIIKMLKSFEEKSY